MSAPSVVETPTWVEAGAAWSHAAADWAYRFERYADEAIEAIFHRLGLAAGTELCDIACGAGFALGRAARRGLAEAGHRPGAEASRDGLVVAVPAGVVVEDRPEAVCQGEGAVEGDASRGEALEERDVEARKGVPCARLQGHLVAGRAEEGEAGKGPRDRGACVATTESELEHELMGC